MLPSTSPASAREAASLRHVPPAGPVLTSSGVAFADGSLGVVASDGLESTVIARGPDRTEKGPYERELVYLASGGQRLGVQRVHVDALPKGGGSTLRVQPFAGPERGPLLALAPACFYASGAPSVVDVSDHADVFLNADCRLVVSSDDGPSYTLPEAARMPKLAGDYLGYVDGPDPYNTANADVVVIDRRTKQEVLRFANPNREVVDLDVDDDGTAVAVLDDLLHPNRRRDVVIASAQQLAPRTLLTNVGNQVRISDGQVTTATGDPLHASLRRIDAATGATSVLASPVTGEFDLRGNRVAWAQPGCRRVRVVETAIEDAPAARTTSPTCRLRLAARPLLTRRLRHLRLQLACDALPADCLPNDQIARLETARRPHRSVLLPDRAGLDYAGRLDLTLNAAAARRLRHHGRLRVRLTDALTASGGSTERRTVAFALRRR